MTTVQQDREMLEHLLTITDRAGVLERMQSLDPNGVWTDEASEAEGMDATDLDHARRVIREWMAELL